MFARFRNLFSKNKIETETGTDVSIGNSREETSPLVNGSCKDSLKKDGIVENEKQTQLNSTVESSSLSPNSLSAEMGELLKKKLSRYEGLELANEEATINQKSLVFEKNKNNSENKEDANEYLRNKEISKESKYGDNEVSNDRLIKINKDSLMEKKPINSKDVSPHEFLRILNNEEIISAQIDLKEDTGKLNLVLDEKVEICSSQTKNEISFEFKNIKPQEEEKVSDEKETNKIIAIKENINIPEQEPLADAKDSSLTINKSNDTENKLIENETENAGNCHTDETELKSLTTEPKINNIKISNDENHIDDCNKKSNELSESSKSSIKENASHSTTSSFLQNLENNLSNNSSIVVEDLPSEITTPSPTVESTISGSSSNTSTLDSSALTEFLDPSKIIVNPIDNNGLACTAITSKLSDIAEVAESLDAVIRDVQENVQAVEDESNPSPCQKKMGALRSASSEDWHSRSTEDDSFATASEGNFTPSSSSYQTASGRTSSYISCDKNSFDANEAEDSTYAFEMPELTSPLNMSFEGSEQSYMSAQHLNGDMTIQGKPMTSTNLEDDQSSVADIEELHSESVTPTPEENVDDYHVESMPIELAVDGIAVAPSMEILTEHTTMPMSRTPEVSPSSSNACSNQNIITTQITVNDQQEQENSATNNNNKPNAAWRRSKYYENITKQTIKGFL